MKGTVMWKLADAIEGVGYTIKDIKEEEYAQYSRPPSGEKYTGLLIIKIRPLKDEEADEEEIRIRNETEKASTESTPIPVPVLGNDEGAPF
jgi:hypothetical protein